MFDPRSPYHRRRWHYESDQPLSIAQLIAARSLDARTAALLWTIIERHRSVIVSGPTDPTPGVGKTTTLNALLEFLPVGSTLVYTVGMYEDFDFLADTEPGATCVLANEVSDHLPIYMWGRVARRLLTLPDAGYAVATSCHADTIHDVLHMLRGDLRLSPPDIGRLGVIINIGLVGRLWPLRRRFLTVHFLRARPDGAESGAPADAAMGSKAAPRRGAVPEGVELVRLAEWDEASDGMVPATPEALARLAAALGMTPDELSAVVDRRSRCLETLAAGKGAGIRATRQAIEQLMQAEAGAAEAPGNGAAAASGE
jgi:hypothetical protein